MALNKYMHGRNIYKNPPDFRKLSNMFSEFSNIAKVDVTGKVTIDFKDPQSLRILTKCLLKCDFNLDVEIPENRLVPTLPLRLNYILWLEDLLNSINIHDDIWGIDIGTGACAVYPLLGAIKNKWHFIATDTDEESVCKAQANVLRNNLSELIKLKRNVTKSLIEFLFIDTDKDCKQSFAFCMCNPPFYSNMQELYESRSPARPLPKNGFTGSPQELITEGGELEFCKKLLKESKDFKEKVVIFTTMIGHKSNMKEFLQELQTEGVYHTSTDFCQGRVTRWGVAWTYLEHDLYKLLPPRLKISKRSTPMKLLLAPLSNKPNDFVTITEKLKTIFNFLNIDFKVLNKRGDFMSLDILALNNTWCNQRRKRRLIKRQEEEAKKRKLNCEDNAFNANHDNNTIVHSVIGNTNNSVENGLNLNNKTTLNTQECSTTLPVDGHSHLVHAVARVFKKNNDFVLEFEFIDGTAGKEGLHQILQYIKNNWK